MTGDEQFLCKRCQKACPNFRSLKLHASVAHTLKHLCVFCQETFANRSALYRHKSKCTASSVNGRTSRRIKCGKCNEKFYKVIDLCKHVKSMHEIITKIEHFEFLSQETFNKWRLDVEKNDNFAFIKRSVHKSPKFMSYTLLCHRSGYFESRRKTKKAPKALVTNKLNFYCSAFAAVKESLENGRITVECCLTHYGHDELLCRTKISSATRLMVAEYLKDQRSIKWILETLRCDMNDNCDERISKREHLITSTDIRQIKRDFGLQPGRLCDDEMESLDLNVKDNRESILCYNGQHSDIENFFLGLQTIAQERLFQKFGSNIVCMDATHGTNRRKLLLITVLVLDDMRRGVPVAWFLCNRENEECLTIFLTALRKRCGSIEAKAFMSDDANQYFNAWSKVFPSAQTKKLLCTWHVLRNWHRNIQSKIATAGARKVIWMILRRMMKLPSAEQFDSAKAILLELLGKFSIDFVTYFEENYCTEKRLPQWTTYSRQNIGINTNMHLERFHRTLKYNFLNKQENHRLDYLFYILLEVSKSYIQNYKVRYNLIGSIGNITEIQCRHKRSEDIDPSDVHVVNDSWKVASANANNAQAGVFYFVKKVLESCTCPTKCRSCHVCYDMYKCTCRDFTEAYYACKHIHRVHSLLQMDIQQVCLPLQFELPLEPLKEMKENTSSTSMGIWDDIRKEMVEIMKMTENKAVRDNFSDPEQLLERLQGTRKMMLSSSCYSSTTQTRLASNKVSKKLVVGQVFSELPISW